MKKGDVDVPAAAPVLEIEAEVNLVFDQLMFTLYRKILLDNVRGRLFMTTFNELFTDRCELGVRFSGIRLALIKFLKDKGFHDNTFVVLYSSSSIPRNIGPDIAIENMD